MAAEDPRFDKLLTSPIRELNGLMAQDGEPLTANVDDLRAAFLLLWSAVEDFETHVTKWAPNNKVEDGINAARWKAAVLAMRPDRLAEISEAADAAEVAPEPGLAA